MNKEKQEYNDLLKRYRKAVEWIDDPKRTDEEIAKYFHIYMDLIETINNTIEALNIEADKETVLNGFKD